MFKFKFLKSVQYFQCFSNFQCDFLCKYHGDCVSYLEL